MSVMDKAVLDQWIAVVTPERWERGESAPTYTERTMHDQRLRSRGYHAATDRRAVVELLLSAQAAERAFDWPSAGQLRALLASPTLDHARDIRVWHTARGSLVAFALLWHGSLLVWFTRPTTRAEGPECLDEQVLAWARERVRAAMPCGAEATLRTDARDPETRRIEALSALGFTPQRREVSLRLRRCLDDLWLESGDEATPAGYRIRRLAAGDLREHLALAGALFPEAWRAPLTAERRRALMADASYMPDLDLVAEAPDGRIVGFCHAALRPDERERLGRRAGWIELLGVAPEVRGQGLGRALLRAGLMALADHGASEALVTVQANNVVARKLYNAEGFTRLYTERGYTLRVAC